MNWFKFIQHIHLSSLYEYVWLNFDISFKKENRARRCWRQNWLDSGEFWAIVANQLEDVQRS